MELTELIGILGNLMVISSLVIIWKWLKNVFSNGLNNPLFKSNSMEPNKCNHLLFYASCFVSIYRLSRPNLPIVSLGMQLLTGGCTEVYQKDKILRFWLGLKKGIVLYTPETVEAVLTSSTLIEKSSHYKLVHPWLGTGIFTSSGEKWRKHRKLLTPTFHFKILENFIPVFQEQSNVFVSKLKTLTGEPWVDIMPLSTLCTLDVICQTAMGVKLNAQRNGNKEYVNAVHEIANALVNRAIRPWLFLDFMYYMTDEGKKYKSNLEIVHGFTRKVTKEKRTEMLERSALKQKDETPEDAGYQGSKRKAFLEFLLEYHFQDPSFTEANIREEVDTFMFGGYETTGTGLSWILYCIGLYPEVQKKVHEELDDIFQDDFERDVTREDLTRMKYLECTIKETFRLYPPAPFFIRECTETLKVLEHTIYPGSFLLVLTYALHRDKNSFPDPEKFIPERFFPENSKGRHPYAYIPFSAGPRNCIGQKFAMMELKTLLSNILRSLRVTSLDPRDKVFVVPNLTLQNTEPLRLKFDVR